MKNFSLFRRVASLVLPVSLLLFAGTLAADTLSDKVVNDIVAHSYDKHVVQQKEFETLTGAKKLTPAGDAVKQKKELGTIVEEVAKSGTKKVLTGGRTAYYDATENILVIHNANNEAQSTVFRPTNGQAYVNGLK